jgi:hypothetical protein
MYIDPAAGSIILQVLAAGALAGAASIKRIRESLKRFLLGRFGRRKDP